MPAADIELSATLVRVAPTARWLYAPVGGATKGWKPDAPGISCDFAIRGDCGVAEKKPKKSTRTTTTPARAAKPRARPDAEAETTAATYTADARPGAPVSEEPKGVLPIVGIGASAGGLAALEAFFSSMPGETRSGIAIVVIQHLSPDHKSLLTELVQRRTEMEVFQASDGLVVKPNCVYIIPPSRNIGVEDGRLVLSQPVEPRGQWLPIDHFFRSLARERGELAIGIVLSGTGSDGAQGLRAIKGEGGMAIAQLPETAEHDGMPRSAINTGLVDFVLAPAQMPRQLVSYVERAFEHDKKTPSTHDGEFIRKLCIQLRAHTGHDFSQYKQTTLVRRVERRMAMHQAESPSDYLLLIRDQPTELEALFRDLLIGVTNFFRDPEAFKLLQDKVLPELLERRQVREPFRIWVCGCSTGEEAYSIAILMQELIEAAKKPYTVQIFATDIDSAAIEHARAGIYPASIASDVPQERLTRFFTHDPEAGTYRIQKVIRDMLVFSEQDVVKDPPFSRLDLVSCRNLLIYLNVDLQKRLLPLFHYALRPGGVMFLGPSETVGENAPLFGVLDRKWKLYQRPMGVPGARPALPAFVPPLRADGHAQARDPVMEDNRPDLRKVTEQALIDHYGHAGVLITARGEILQIVGRTGKFLEPSAGDATMNINAMAREGLRRELSVAIHKAVAQRQPAAYRGLRVKPNGGVILVDLVVRPAPGVPGSAADYYLVILEDKGEADARAPEQAPRDRQSHEHIMLLEQELRAKEEYLQTTLEEMETTNEELKSTNEEMQSVNEELQSTNEELETSKEELQSVNEELSTVNAELQDKVTDLSRVNNDMNNLLAGTGIGTVFVDHQLRISRYTPAATQVINLIPSDVGRPVEHVVPNFLSYGTLVQDIRRVLGTLAPMEAEVQVKSGAWYLLRIRPYRTMENVIEGAVITMVDISERKRAEASLHDSDARFQAVVSQAYAGVVETDLQGRILYANDRLCDMLGYTQGELAQKYLHEVVHADDQPRHMAQFESLVAGGPAFEIEKRYQRKDGAPVWVITRFSAVSDGVGRPRSLVTIAFDVTERKRLENELSRTDVRLANDLDALSKLQAVSNLYIAGGNQHVVLDEIVDAAISITGAEMGNLQILDAGSRRLVVAAQRGLPREWIEFWNNHEDQEGSCTVALRLGQRVVVEDVQTSAIFKGTEALEVQLRAGIRAVQSTPLIGRSGQMVGMVSTHFRTPHRPDARVLRLLDLLVRQAADIIDRARADDQLKL